MATGNDPILHPHADHCTDGVWGRAKLPGPFTNTDPRRHTIVCVTRGCQAYQYTDPDTFQATALHPQVTTR